jgi:hypothetical protein
MTVDCPFCGDKSFREEIKGQHCLGNIESKKVIIVKTPTDVEQMEDGTLLQTVIVKTIKGEQ